MKYNFLTTYRSKMSKCLHIGLFTLLYLVYRNHNFRNKILSPVFQNCINYQETILNRINNGPSLKCPKIIINPPQFISQTNRKLLHNLNTKISLAVAAAEKDVLKIKLSSILSNVVQNQLASLQFSQNCSGINIICGHENYCGLGCQIHHRVACLIVSFALGVPLIHDESNWSYNDKWNSAFLPFGSDCHVGPETYRLEWGTSYPVLYKDLRWMFNKLQYGSVLEKYEDQIEYPLKNGIPVSTEIADLVEIVHDFPFIWWVGQFMKFALRLNPEMKNRIDDAKKEINYTHPIVGLHVRRTDKLRESKDFLYPIEDYMNIAKEYYRNSSKDETLKAKNVFVASEDATVIKSTMEKYPDWNIIGFKSRKT